ncbi:hypothetical protein ED28_17150 [[Pantoea] beijingensis]|uniref:Acyltransferase 3 domain-containing protein n=2 Tax=[Pantoea] beijingensis TaxID=1324864 RepID=A0A443I8T8_9GAMM|nr:hypothetical protein ED28_17150 [[Pantoea] beijingensis]
MRSCDAEYSFFAIFKRCLSQQSEIFMSVRDARLDNIKGGLILLVIFGHLIEPLVDMMPALNRIYNFIYLFHIPAFVLVSGYVSHPNKEIRYSALLKSLVVPFIVFSIIYETSDFIALGEVSGYLKVLSPNWILWFLFSLIIWRVFAPLFLKIRFNLLLLLALSSSISLIEIDGYVFSIFRTVVFFPFYMLGVLLSRYKDTFLHYQLKPSLSIFSLVILGGIFFLNLPFDRLMLYGVAPFSAFGYSNEYGVIQRLCYYPVSILAIFSFGVLVSKLHLLNKIGSNSLYVYLLHGLIVKYLLWPYMTADDWSVTGVVLLALSLTIILAAILSSTAITRLTSMLFQAFQRLILKNRQLA